jgi:hypothetical protein
LTLQLVHKFRRTLTACGLAIAAVLAFASPASANHTPVQLDSGDVLPWNGPLILNGADPFFLFGVLPTAGAVRSAQMQMQAGQPLIVTLGVPDLAPENQLTTTQLPKVLLIAPDLSTTLLEPNVRIPLYADETEQDFLLLNIYQATAVSGTYSIVTIGGAPERFFVGTGIEGGPFNGIERATVASIDEVIAWYNTAP